MTNEFLFILCFAVLGGVFACGWILGGHDVDARWRSADWVFVNKTTGAEIRRPPHGEAVRLEKGMDYFIRIEKKP